jgi:hypothetical protein
MAKALTPPKLNPFGLLPETHDTVMMRKAHVYLSLELQHNGVTEFSDTLVYLLQRIENLEAKLKTHGGARNG